MHDGEDADRANDRTETGGAPRVGCAIKIHVGSLTSPVTPTAVRKGAKTSCPPKSSRSSPGLRS